MDLSIKVPSFLCPSFFTVVVETYRTDIEVYTELVNPQRHGTGQKLLYFRRTHKVQIWKVSYLMFMGVSWV